MATTYNLYYQPSPNVVQSPIGVDAWASNKLYQAGNMVLKDGTVYTAAKDHKSDVSFDTDKWWPKKITGLADVIKTVNDLDVFKTYYVAVTSVVDGVESVSCQEVSVKPKDTSVPANLKAEFDIETVGKLDVSWSPIYIKGQSALSYNLYWSIIPVFTKEQAIVVAANTHSYSMSSIDRTGKYYFMVTANYNNGTDLVEGNISATVQAIDVSVPNGVTATADKTSIAFSWNPVILKNKFPEGYYAIVDTTESGLKSSTPFKKVRVSWQTVECTVTGLVANTNYYYAIISEYNDGTGATVTSPITDAATITTLS